MDFLSFILTPLLCGAVGYSTNWLAIKMLFRPHREIRIAGFRLPFTPGLVPKERKRLARKVAETVSRHVLTPEVLARELAALAKSADGFHDLRMGKNLPEQIPVLIEWMKTGLEENPALEEWLREMVRKIIHEHISKLAGFFLDSGKIYKNIKEGLFDYLSDPENQVFLLEKADKALSMENAPQLERVLESIVSYIAHHIPIREMIENKMNAFAVDEAEKIILSVVNHELRIITALGGVLGFIIGLVSLVMP